MRHLVLLSAALAVAECDTAQGVKNDAEIAGQRTEDAVKRAGRATGSAIERAGDSIERIFQK
jgi:predicted small secreted protein